MFINQIPTIPPIHNFKNVSFRNECMTLNAALILLACTEADLMLNLGVCGCLVVESQMLQRHQTELRVALISALDQFHCCQVEKGISFNV